MTTTRYQYLVTTIAGTPEVDVPTAAQTQQGAQFMVQAIALSLTNGVYNVKHNGDNGMWWADGTPRLRTCGQ